LSETTLSATTLPTEWRLLLLVPLVSFLETERCVIRMGIPPKSKSSFKDLVKNLMSVSESRVFPRTNATNVGGRALTCVKYLTLGCAAWSFQECLLITWSKPTHSERWESKFTTNCIFYCNKKWRRSNCLLQPTVKTSRR